MINNFERSGRTFSCAVAALTVLLATGCGSDGGGGSVEMQSFSLRFAAMDGSREVGCADTLTGFGPDAATSIRVSDLRFYVSNLRFFTANGEQAAVELDPNDFEYVSGTGSVAMIDLTGTGTGACAGTGLTYPEGTARTNNLINGMTSAADVSRVTFDVGIPQPLMKKVIADHTAEDAPSPLAEMHWSWGYAYRHFVMNFVLDHSGTAGEGYLHVGSNDCGGDGSKALTDIDSCGKVNAPAVDLAGFNLGDTVVVNLRSLLANLDLQVSHDEVSGPGVECHSSVSQPDCAIIFGNLGINQATGTAQAGLNHVFSIK